MISNASTILLVFLVLVVSISERDTDLISHAQREGPSIMGNNPPAGPGKLTPETISGGNNSNGQILTTQMVAKQLATMDSDKIANYPIKDLSPTDLVTVFSNISPAVLEKTLSSISDADLAIIFNKISMDKRQQILDRLSPDIKQPILNRLRGSIIY